MVHFAWRFQHGVELYPLWRPYPHVANFYAPLNFMIVGLLGRAFGSEIGGLYYIGRFVTFTSVVLTSLVLGLVMYRRYGKFAALLGMALSLGAGPLFHTGVMTRPDALAELLGLSGFFLATGQKSVTRAIGGVSLYFAAMTKQTALVYFLAAVLGLSIEARPKQALLILAGVTLALLATVLIVQLGIQPNFVASLLGESQMPYDFKSWWSTVRTVSLADPEFFFLTIAGIVIWSSGPRRGADCGTTLIWTDEPTPVKSVLSVGAKLTESVWEPKLAVLTALVVAAGLVTATKRGSAENYFLGMRCVTALAAGVLWHSLATKAPRPRVWEVLTLAAVVAGTAYSILSVEYFWRYARREAIDRASGPGRTAVQFYERLLRDAQDPGRRFFTDMGLIDVRQGTRTVFGDPYRFKIMGENGQLDLRFIETNLENEYYDVIFCHKDLFAPEYGDFEFAMPKPLAERARRHYRLGGFQYGLHIYYRRGKQVGSGEKPGL